MDETGSISLDNILDSLYNESFLNTNLIMLDGIYLIKKSVLATKSNLWGKLALEDSDAKFSKPFLFKSVSGIKPETINIEFDRENSIPLTFSIPKDQRNVKLDFYDDDQFTVMRELGILNKNFIGVDSESGSVTGLSSFRLNDPYVACNIIIKGYGPKTEMESIDELFSSTPSSQLEEKFKILLGLCFLKSISTNYEFDTSSESNIKTISLDFIPAKGALILSNNSIYNYSFNDILTEHIKQADVVFFGG